MRPLRRVLLLDNNNRERQFFATLAKTVCDDVVEVSSARDAIRALGRKHRRPSLIVATLEAEKKAAIKVLRRLRASHLSLPVVLIVAPGAKALVPLARDLGVRFFVNQPLHAEGFDSALRQALENGKLTPTGRVLPVSVYEPI